MPGSLADYAENGLLDHLFGATTFTPPATLYFGLSTTTITDAGTGITEPSGNGYVRKAVTNNGTNFSAASGGSKSNALAITFASATGSWGTVTDWFISDAASGGNIIAKGTLSTARSIANGDTPSFAASAFSIACD